jgi:hypothetical protein
MTELYLPLEDPASHARIEQAASEEMTAEQYEVLLRTAQGEAATSLLAGSIFELSTTGVSSVAHSTMIIESAQKVAGFVRRFGKRFDESPDEILLLASEHHLYFANTNDTTLALTKRGKVAFQLGRFTNAHSGSVGIVELRDENTPWGRGNFSVDPSVFQTLQPAGSTIDHSLGSLRNVTLGRSEIIGIHKERVQEESDDGLIESRLKTVPYAFWLMRGIDPQLNRSIHASAVRVGLVASWREQSLNEAGSFLAALKRRKPRTATEIVNSIEEGEFVQLDEVKIFNFTAEEIAQQAVLHAERRRMKFDPEALHDLAAAYVQVARRPSA